VETIFSPIKTIHRFCLKKRVPYIEPFIEPWSYCITVRRAKPKVCFKQKIAEKKFFFTNYNFSFSDHKLFFPLSFGGLLALAPHPTNAGAPY
jgi:hypothetical protein